jgi:hypothetical protein
LRKKRQFLAKTFLNSVPGTHLVVAQRFDERVGLFQPAVHEERDADGQTAEDLLVLRLLGPIRLISFARNLQAELDQGKFQVYNIDPLKNSDI